MGSLQIIHRPTGIDHPYEPFFDERRPRDPSAGDMVALGFLTRPGRLAESVRVEWTRNSRRQTPIFARALERGTDEDRWLVELGVLDGGDEIEYRILAQSEDGSEAGAPVERFVTRSWYRANESAGDAGRILSLTVERLEEQGGLRFALDPGSNSADSPGVQPAEIDSSGRLCLPRLGGEPVRVTVRWQTEAGRITAVELTGPLAPDEAICGFGERFDALDQRGRALDSTVFEQYKNQGNRTYLPVPFFLSNKGYGLLVEGTSAVEFDVGRSVPDRWRCVAQVPQSGAFAFRWFNGEPDAIVRALTAATGRPEPLPDWAYGLWMSSNEWNTRARVEHEVAATLEHGIPATVLVVEAWSDESTFYIWNGARYAPRPGAERPTLADFEFPADGPWPDPAGLTQALHDAGIRLVLWQIPALKALDEPHDQHDADVAHALERGYVLRNDDGTPYRNPFFWFNDAHIPDFTNPDATAWWMGKRAYLLDEIGVDGFKTDGGEHLAGRGLRAADGRRGDELVNAYPNLYVSAYHRFATELRQGDALTFSRAGHTGAGALPAHWAGDENSTWEAYCRSIVAGLTAGLSGVIFWGWDLAGFSDVLPTVELYVRSAAMAAFCPIMQYHSEYNPSGPSRDRTPWNIAAHWSDDRAIFLFRHFARVRMNLLPFLVEEGRYAAEQGTPMLRPLFLDWPDDPTCWQIADQYAFGRSLLVAPVVEKDATTRTLYLPAGEWVDIWDGTTHDGGAWITIDAPWDRIPVFARHGAVIPLRLGDGGRLGSDTGNGLSVTEGVINWTAG